MSEPRRVLEYQIRTARTRLERAELAGADPRGDEADVAGNTELRNVAGTSRAAVVTQLRLAAAALERLDAGTWGTCLDCGTPIGARRLVAAPEVETCISCQEQRDRLARRDAASAAVPWIGDDE